MSKTVEIDSIQGQEMIQELLHFIFSSNKSVVFISHPTDKNKYIRYSTVVSFFCFLRMNQTEECATKRVFGAMIW